jgi:G:T-mismatch repair DNA endonuclease (very short patch repair protein)
METALAWPQLSKTDAARRAAELVDDTVTDIRNRGHTREHALRLAATVLGLRFRRARALLYGDPVALHDEELARIRAAFLHHLDSEAEHLTARSAAARARLARMAVEP